MTWEQAEALFPGCSAEWDVKSSNFSGTWQVEEIYLNSRDGITVRVVSTDPDDFRGKKGEEYGWAFFSYGPGDDEFWWGRC